MSNCWELLNIRETSDRRSIKIAYTTRIKEFSPETDPDKFQQLREAYDQAMYISQFLDESEEPGDGFGEPALVEMSDPEPPGDLAVAQAPVQIAPAAEPAQPLPDFLTAEEFMVRVNAVWDDAETKYDTRAWLALLDAEELQDIMLKQELWYSLFHFFADIVYHDVENNTVRFPQKVVRAYNDVFQWSEDELELQRCFNHEYVQAMMWMIQGVKAVPVAQSGETKSGWRNVWVWFVVLVILAKVFAALERDDRDGGQDLGGLSRTQALFEEGDYQQALEIARPFAEQGHAYAQNLLGIAYKNGWGVERDHVESVHWFQLAADQNFIAAQVNLGLAYFRGEGVAQDYSRSRRLFDLAASKNNPTAKLFSGLQYLKGLGVEKDESLGVKQITAAANRGYGPAEHELGRLYFEGQGVEQSDTEAVRWFEKAAAQEIASSQNAMGYLYQNGRGVERDFDKALFYYGAAADQGNPLAMYNLGRSYLFGIGVDVDPDLARSWLTRAADGGSRPARRLLEEMAEP